MSPATTPRPASEADYRGWARDNLHVDFDGKECEQLFSVNVSAALIVVQDSPFWNAMPDAVDELAARYRSKYNAELLASREIPRLLKKSYVSTVDKTYRLNVIWNRNWPDPPASGWVTDGSLYTHLDDLVRCTLVCSFLDGPGLVADRLQKLAESLGYPATVRRLNRDEGYYAHHLYVDFPVDVAKKEGGTERHQLALEIQITTQPQELLRHLTHPYYREQRSKLRADRGEWKWNYTSNEFKARYLSHALHLLEAMILDVRDNPDSDEPGSS